MCKSKRISHQIKVKKLMEVKELNERKKTSKQKSIKILEVNQWIYTPTNTLNVNSLATTLI